MIDRRRAAALHGLPLLRREQLHAGGARQAPRQSARRARRTNAVATTLLALALLGAAPASPVSAAEIQTSGSEQFPGKMLLHAHPIGVQTGFNFGSASGFRLGFQFAGILSEQDKLTWWLGGEAGYAIGFFACGIYSGLCGHDFQFGMFVMLSFEKLVPIPLVPYARAGFVGDILVANSVLGGGGGLKIAGGAHYFLLKNLGLGAEIAFTTGLGAISDGRVTSFGFYGSWEFTLGARFVF